MGLGDELMAAGHAQRVYDADPLRKVAICDDRGRVRWHQLWAGNPIIAGPMTVAAGQPVHRIVNGPGCRPYIHYPFTTDTGWRYNRAWRARDHVGRLHLTAAELAQGQHVITRQPYVLIEPCVSSRSTRNKAWPFERYAAVVAACPEIAFVQPLHAEAVLLPGVEYVGTSTFRQACGLLAGAIGYVGIEGAFHHAARILQKPAVVLVGGAIDWDVLGYPDQVGLVDEGPGSPCGSWKPCAHCAAALEAITVDRVVRAVRQVFGRLCAGGTHAVAS